MREVTALLARVCAAKDERQKAHAAMQRNFAPDFNPVALLAPGETRLSEVLRWLLDEHETHGQGAHFRDLFITHLVGRDPSTWASATVACEVVTKDGRGRIDLLLKSADGRKRIAIENKPWAGWQEKQLKRYLDDQLIVSTDVHVLALIGTLDAGQELLRHWPDCPSNVTAQNFDAVANWLEDCAAGIRPEHVRRFLYNTADYCRRFVMNQVHSAKASATADLLVSAGPEMLKAAIDVAEALPMALTQQVAQMTEGSYRQVGSAHAVQIFRDGVPLSFVLFGSSGEWAGVTDAAFVGQLNTQIAWGHPDRNWPGWAWIKDLGDQGAMLADAAAASDFERAAALIPAVAQIMLGTGVLTTQ